MYTSLELIFSNFTTCIPKPNWTFLEGALSNSKVLLNKINAVLIYTVMQRMTECFNSKLPDFPQTSPHSTDNLII